MKTILGKIDQQMAANLYHGASLALYRDGVWREHYIGTQDGETPVLPGLAYDLASVSKVVGVATICIFLLNSGAIRLDDSLVKYYPEFHDKSVTLRQLLTHTTGINPFIPNRDRLSENELKEAINQITVTDHKAFHYTDINFLLLGFMLEEILGCPLAEMFQKDIFIPWKMTETDFGPVKGAVPTVKGVTDGLVHDPKAKVLGRHAGSAGLFSTLSDLKRFCQHYLEDDFAENLWTNISLSNKTRSIGWNLDGDWIDHTGYTGPFVMLNRKEQCAAIFLTNRTFEYDDRPLWIAKRRELRDVIQVAFSR
ncbi:serine hydrolase domain-containing protein [Streptococcus sp. S784/96/1]|uniref:serine hydrolase domain-containing protein n=1 Tax=Streptococcus sp. S784/96/1 TaxID=2653499 RepID=UPI0013894F7B|nr:serine hydrolase domain-containing protein [Streptococcus sp. S784/96/1]